MFGSIYVGMSGLQAHSQGLQTISNNVSNLNSQGFKSSTARFVDLYRGGPNGQLGTFSQWGQGYGGGVRYAYARTDFSQGDLQASDGTLDLAINGDGFIAVLDDGEVRYMRSGQFEVDKDGWLIDKNTGLNLAALADDGTLQPISIRDKSIDPPTASSQVVFSGNLSSGATEFKIPSIDIYDESGTKHTLSLEFKPDNQIFPGRWKVTVKDDESRVLTDATLQFLGGIPEPGSDVLEVELELVAGSTQTVKLDFSNGVTSFSSGSISSLKVDSTDGSATGEFASLRIDGDGRIEIGYSNGNTATLDKVAMASFKNPQQLEQSGQGLFNASDRNLAHYATSGQNGLGQLLSGAAEASNVDLSGEFGRLILMQRGFQASSQVISTANEMIQQLFQMRSQG